MAHRFYCPELALAGDEVVLDGDEAAHLLRTLRAKPGDVVELFDGVGLRATAAVQALGRRDATLALRSRQIAPPAPASVLAVALPKGERAAWLTEKAVELGAGTLAPLTAERSVAGAGEAKLDKLRRTAVEACKQCGRDRLPEILAPAAWATFAPRLPAGAVGWLLHPGAPPAAGAPRWAAIGPEGGWTDAELRLGAAAGWRVVGLPGHVLRVETAALALVARMNAAPECSVTA